MHSYPYCRRYNGNYYYHYLYYISQGGYIYGRHLCTWERGNFNVILQVCISVFHQWPYCLGGGMRSLSASSFQSVSLLGEKARRLHWRPVLLNMMLTLFHSIYSSQEVFLMPSCRTHTHCRFCLPPNPPSSVFPPSTMGNNYLRDLLKQNKDIQNNKF